MIGVSTMYSFRGLAREKVRGEREELSSRAGDPNYKNLSGSLALKS